MQRPTEDQPAAVPKAKQVGADRPATDHPLWRTAKPCAWTLRMLTALMQGVKGEKWFALYDKVFAERNLVTALQQVASKKGAPGVDHVTTHEFEQQVPETIWQLSDSLREGTYQPQAIRRVHIPKPGTTETRPLAPFVWDRAHGSGSRGAGSGRERDRTDLRERLRRAELWVSTGTWMQGCVASDR